MTKQWKSCSKNAAHEHVCGERTSREHKVGVDEVTKSALKYREESKSKAGGANREPV